MSERVSMKSLERCLSRLVNELATRCEYHRLQILEFSEYLVVPAGTRLSEIDNCVDRVTQVDSHVTGLVSAGNSCYVEFLETNTLTSFSTLPHTVHLQMFSEEFVQKLLAKILEIRQSRENS